MDPLILAGGVVVGLVVLFAIFKAMWRVAEPNEALVISGLREHSSPEGAGESMGFRIVTGKDQGVHCSAFRRSPTWG